VSTASLKSDLLAAQHRAANLAARVGQLERRLSALLGEQTWRDSGLGAPDDLDQLHQRIASLEVQVADLRIQLDERNDELAAARLANREMMSRLNASRPTV
jgi:polyhydroxyalkanoate synthesis regulator phasin